MGAWGVGMQASDDALDAIAGVEHLKPSKWTHKLVTQAIDHVGSDDSWARMHVLGLADWLLDREIALEPVKELLHSIADAELDPDALRCWRDAEARKDALTRFKNRLDGKDVDEEALAEDNEGLLCKMSRFAEDKDGLDTH